MPDPFSGIEVADRLLIGLAWSIVALGALCVVLAGAALLLRLRNSFVARRWDRFEAAWEGPILDVLAGGPPEELVGTIAGADAPFFIDFLTRYGQQVRGVELDRLAGAAAPFLGHPRSALRARVPEQRARAVAALGMLGGPADVRLVIDALDDPSPLVAMSAARALTRRRDPRHAAALVAHLDRLRHWRPSFLAAMLAGLGPDAAPALRRTLEDPAALARVRAVAAEALLKLNDLSAADAAAAALDATDPEVVAAALRLLAQVGQGQHLPIVRRLATAEEDIVRLGAFRVLGALGEPEDVPLLEQGLHDASIWVAEQAARGLARGSGRALLAAVGATELPRARLAREVLAGSAP